MNNGGISRPVYLSTKAIRSATSKHWFQIINHLLVFIIVLHEKMSQQFRNIIKLLKICSPSGPGGPGDGGSAGRNIWQQEGVHSGSDRSMNTRIRTDWRLFCNLQNKRWLSPGQTDSQVDASFRLAFNLRFVWQPICVDLHKLATTCVWWLRWLWSSSNLDASRRKFFTVWPSRASRHKLIASNLLSVRTH